jgi:GMP synthase-like glutamine amidotransferase
MQIGILQTGQAPDALRASAGDYPDMFAQLLAAPDMTFRTWHVEAMDFPASPEDADGWLITGSRHGAYEDHAFIPRLEQFIRDVFVSARPLVGICFGHQIMAQAMGGRVEKFAGGWAVGPQSYDFDGESLRLNAWHQDQVTVVPPDARVVASNDFCRYAALAYGDRGFSVQAHPEFHDSFVQGLIDTRGRGVVPEDRLLAATQALGRDNDAGVVAMRIRSLFRKHAPMPAQT